MGQSNQKIPAEGPMAMEDKSLIFLIKINVQGREWAMNLAVKAKWVGQSAQKFQPPGQW
jgi:hypothetical protein